MNVKSVFNKKAAAVVGVVAIAATAGTGASVAAKQITTNQIKDGTIQTKDLTKNNFAKFTSTEAVFNAETPISANPAYAGARVVDVNANGTTLVLDKGTYKLSGMRSSGTWATPRPPQPPPTWACSRSPACRPGSPSSSPLTCPTVARTPPR